MANHLKQDAWKNFSPNLGGQEWGWYSTVLGDGASFEDLFVPTFWKHHASGPKALIEGDIVRVIAADRSFDVDVTVDKIVHGGIEISLRCGRVPVEFKGFHPDEIREIFKRDESQFEVVRMANGKPLPRVEYMDRLDTYRVVGNDNDVIEDAIKAKGKAEARLERYLREARLRLPTEAEAAKHREDEAKLAEARKPRKSSQAAA